MSTHQHDNDDDGKRDDLHLSDVPHLDDLDVGSAGLTSADHFQVMRCHDCSHAHVVLFHSDGTPFAQVVLGPENVENIERECHKVFAGRSWH